jgi:diguanylate cyclase (GGDEF)-like protein/PAS domain S-box-containing protein
MDMGANGFAIAPARAALSRLIAGLPAGKTLPPRVWHRRHRGMVWLVWAHVPMLAAFGLLQGYPLWHVSIDVAPIATFGGAAMLTLRSTRFRACMVALGLLTSSAVLVHLSGGAIEAHFHFFVMVTILACYEEWFPYLLALVFVVVHHGTVGVLLPSSVYDHAGAVDHPWKWAGIHGLFIAALGVANIVSWRMNEDVRAETVEAHGRTLESEARFRGAFDGAPIGMAIVEADGSFSRVNPSLCRTTGHGESDLLGMTIGDLGAPPEPGAWPEPADAELERSFRRADGTVGWALWQHHELRDRDGAGYFISQCVDISTRKEAESELAFQAHHDSLTGLPNRTLFLERLGAEVDRRSGESGAVAVAFIDIDNFKVINDSLGHGAGDRLITAVAQRLGRVLREGDVVARFGGDEFTVLMRDIADEAHALRIADRMITSLRPPFVLDGEQRFLSASVGLTLTGAGVEQPDELLRDADAAMYRAKELGKGRTELFDESMRARAIERLDLESGLRHALERDELRLVYQPEVALPEGRIIGVEALLRWHHPAHGIISPAKFIPIAEQSGVIVPIGEWVLREACEQAVRWRAAGHADLIMSVNLSPRQLGTVDLVNTIAAVLTDTGLEPAALCLEVTETALMADVTGASEALQQLKALGVKLAIDDFGIGYSSLQTLKQLLPVDVLKIDKTFVDGLVENDEDHAIVQAVIRLAESLGLAAVAEGVEHAEQANELGELACGFAQGYHFARPQDPDAISALLAGAQADPPPVAADQH